MQYMDFQTYLIFTIATALIIFSPGPSAVLMASQGAINGFKRTLLGVFGITCATIIYFVLSATGIASLILASHTLFQIIKWAGVAYLIYLGCTAILLQCIIYGAYAYLGHRLVQVGVKDWIINAINKTAGAALIFAGLKMASITANR